jgi:hypothetical protein
MADDDFAANLEMLNRALMTHGAPETPQPYMHPGVPGAVDALRNFATGGLSKAMGWEPGLIGSALQNPDNQAALGALRLMPIGEPDVLGPYAGTRHFFDIQNDAGQSVGKSWMRYRPAAKDVLVDDIYGDKLKNVNSLGPSEIRSLLSEVKRHFPDAEEIGGMRVSGARKATGSGPAGVTMALPKGLLSAAQ